MHNARPSPLVHRDLKPANIGVVSYLDQSIVIVILDHGQTIRVQPHNSIRDRLAPLGTKRRKCNIKSITPLSYLVLRNYWPENVCTGMAPLFPIGEWIFRNVFAMLGADDKYTPRKSSFADAGLGAR